MNSTTCFISPSHYKNSNTRAGISRERTIEQKRGTEKQHHRASVCIFGMLRCTVVRVVDDWKSVLRFCSVLFRAKELHEYPTTEKLAPNRWNNSDFAKTPIIALRTAIHRQILSISSMLGHSCNPTSPFYTLLYGASLFFVGVAISHHAAYGDSKFPQLKISM